MHLTNYAINKESDVFVQNEHEDKCDVGHKRSLTSILDHIDKNKQNNCLSNLRWATHKEQNSNKNAPKRNYGNTLSIWRIDKNTNEKNNQLCFSFTNHCSVLTIHCFRTGNK